MSMLPIRIQLGKTQSGTHYPPGVFRTRSYIDPVMMELQGGVSSSNFQVVKLASFSTNGEPFFNDIAEFQVVEYGNLYVLQYDEPGEFGSLS